jgi:hypothetical protein
MNQSQEKITADELMQTLVSPPIHDIPDCLDGEQNHSFHACVRRIHLTIKFEQWKRDSPSIM